MVAIKTKYKLKLEWLIYLCLHGLTMFIHYHVTIRNLHPLIAFILYLTFTFNEYTPNQSSFDS